MNKSKSFFFFVKKLYYSFQNEKFDYIIINLKTNSYAVVEIRQESSERLFM